MRPLKVVVGLLALFVTMPLWFFLVYKILDTINASELMWFIYWIYVPFTVLVGIISKLIEE